MYVKKHTISLLLLLVNLTYVYSYISQGIYAVSGYNYEGAVSDGSLDPNVYLIQKKVIHSDDAYSADVARECKSVCLEKNCKSFVVDRLRRICYATSLDRCKNPTVPLRMFNEYRTYDMMLQNSTNGTGVKTTCFRQCLSANNGNCNACGRKFCFGVDCSNCWKACWETVPPLNGTTYFWVNLQTNIWVSCYNEWQTIFKNGAYTIYSYLFKIPVWLRLVLYFSDGSFLSSFFDNFVLSGAIISVGNYIGGNAGNAWGAPFYNRSMKNYSLTNCYNFYFLESNCSVPQLLSYSQQKAMNATVIKRGYTWEVCNTNISNSVYITNIEFRITAVNASLLNNVQFLQTLPIVNCTQL